jgi:1,4-dihydroxy-2-naphthoyl-CoA synthase
MIPTMPKVVVADLTIASRQHTRFVQTDANVPYAF